MKNPFYHYAERGKLMVEDQRTGEVVASNISRHYIHHLIDFLNADANRRARDAVSRRELLKAFE